jgi:uncharacterized membrane protein YedE/YeeE
MKKLLVAFVTALIFGVGLVLSGMTLPSKVLGFLDVAGSWDPSLMVVMLGAVLVHSVSYRFITKRKSPVLTTGFQIPTRRDIDWKLILGSAIFGMGWGLGGFCPGPALVGLASGKTPVLVFAGSMVLGMMIHRLLDTQVLQKKGK